jgi:hypothetical protein
VIHPTYRYLERATRIAGLTWRQWTLLMSSAIATYLLAKTLPLPSPYGLSVALTVCGTPAAAVLALASTETHVALSPAVLFRWHQVSGRYVPLPPASSFGVGYVVTAQNDEA